MYEKSTFLLPGCIPVLLAAAQLFCACTELNENQAHTAPGASVTAIAASLARTATNTAFSGENYKPPEAVRVYELLDHLAELERSGLFQQGMGMAESGLWESLGESGYATVAAFKEMLWAYGHGEFEAAELVQGLKRIIDLEGQPGMEAAVSTAHAIIAFQQGRWDDAGRMLTALYGIPDEPDGFINWMILSCALEQNPADRKTVSAYRAIRARYAQFPEYWYRGAKVFLGLIGAEYAELCINLAPAGPYAIECRSILASFSGLGPQDGHAIRSKAEIENVISQAVNTGNPALLQTLMPLISLPENPFTVYAIGALRPLAAISLFKDYFTGLAARSGGRLAERLAYICRS